MSDDSIAFADLAYPSKISKLYHISDIHIRLQKRHDEYKKVFNNLYNNLKDEVKNNLGGDSSKGLIIITGDILHSKTELSPECVSLTADFFQKLSKIMPLVIMAGNHDANLNNNNRLDSLTPIVEKVISKSQCYYLRQSGYYQFNNVLIGLTSVFDYNFINASNISKLELDGIDHTVALFHGRVDGAITDTGTVMEGERGINKKSFDGYDYVLLGDIHKQQFLIPNKMAYSGSLIQQNHGESQTRHGYLVWNLKEGNVEAKEVKNDYGFITLRIKEGKLLKNKDCIIPANCYLRLEIDDKTTREEQKKILDSLNKKCVILELIQSNTRTIDRNEENGGGDGNGIDDEDANNEMLRSLSFNVSNHQYQNMEIEKYLISKKVSEDMIEKVKQLNAEYNQQILIAETILGGSWKLKTLEFGNLFCYGDNNFISFERSKGIVGLVAPNHSGKSSILDIILFTLFDKTSRKGAGRDVLRLGEKTFKCKLEIEMDNKTFVIKKTGNKKASDTMSVAIDFCYYSRDDAGKIVSTKLTGKTPAETKRVIESYFGTFDDMVMTSISLQNNNTQFADSTTAEKRKEFEKLLRIDIFERLKDVSAEVSREKKAIIKHISGEIPDDILKNLLDEHITLNEKLVNIESDLETEKENLNELRQEESGLMIRLSSAINQVPSEYKELVKKGNNELEKYKTKLINDIDNLKDEFDLEAAAEVFSTANMDDWKTKENERKKKLREVESKIDTLTRKLHLIPSRKVCEISPLEKEKMTEESNMIQEGIYKMKMKLKKLKECDWEEKEKIMGICDKIVENQIIKHPRKGGLVGFYDDLEETIKDVLDNKYQPGSQKEIDELSGELRKMNTKLDNITKNIQDYDEYCRIIEWKASNEVIQKDIDVLKKKKKKLEGSEFDISSFMDYQKLCKMETELKNLEIAFDNLRKYSETHTKLNDIMSKVLKSEKMIEDLEESRGNMKGSIGVVEAEMKNVKDKKKKLEECILEMDVISTYQDCLKAVPFIIIDKIIPQLENTINLMLASLVNFTLNFKITDKELNVYITRPHGQIPLSNASGFEKFVGSLFLRIGLIKISNLPKANFLAIDEGWSNFDYENMNNVSMIMDYLRGEFDFVILVSHLQAMREQTDQQINIKIEKKTGGEFGLSSVEYK